MKNKKGFTLVELLAVIAILAILVVIALPNVINMYNKAQKETFLTEAKKVYSESEKKFISNSISNKQTKIINSEDSTKLDMTGKKLQYCVILNSSGKVTDMKVSNGKWIASLNGKAVEDLTIDDLEDGNLDDYNCGSNEPSNPDNPNQPDKPSNPDNPNYINCTFNGNMVQGAEFIDGKYTYRYMQKVGYNVTEKGIITWVNISTDGWGVSLTDKNSTEMVSGKTCSTINNRPVVSMSYMFFDSNASTVDVSEFDTKNVVDMQGMFYGSQATVINGFEKFNTSNVTNMRDMFYDSKVVTFDLSSFDTRNVTNMRYMFYNNKASKLELANFNTKNVTDMSGMFYQSKASIIDISSFDTSNATSMIFMFGNAKNLKTIYASDKFVTNKVTSSTNMFSSSTNLVGGAGTIYNSSKTDKTFARIDGGSSNPGYFTKK